MKYLKLYLNDESYMADKPNLGKLWVASTKSEKHVYYSSEINNSLCFTAMENGASVQMGLKVSYAGDPAGWQDKNFYYKKNDDVEWTLWEFNNNMTSKITLNKGEKLYVRSDSYNSCAVYNEDVYNGDVYKIYAFNINEGRISASGNIMSLLNFTPVLPNYAFYQLFESCSSLVSAPELPATTLANNCYKFMFSYCSSLTQAPELPATTLAVGCYCGMFSDCYSLTQAPELPTTTLASDCYNGMFQNCTSLTQAPELPTTTLTDGCYSNMFNNCSSLTQAPELPAITCQFGCYSGMFSSCRSLTQAPDLPATTLAVGCYNGMFSDCSSLTQAPSILPATTLAESCYYSMFNNCTSLTQAPELPATTLVDSCYNYMFDGCSKLNYIKALFTTTPSNTYTYDWVARVSSTGTFVKSKDATWDVTGYKGIPDGWTVQVEKDYLLFTSTGDSTVAMTQKGTPNTSANKVIQYKLNDGQWQTWDLSAVSLADGDKMYLKSDDDIPISESSSICKKFVMSGSIAASGNTMSLLNFSTTLSDYAFFTLFGTCKSLTQAPELPATTLGTSCYKRMFENCSSLTQAPSILPATTLKADCYSSMFQKCTALTEAPVLPADTLANSCYETMFSGCTSLTTAPELPATTLEYYCYRSMFYNCSSLTQAPELPATDLKSYCYSNMFSGCTKLNYVKAMFITTNLSDLTSGFIIDWLSGVSRTGTFIKNAAATWDNTAAGIPSGWTVTTV